MKKSISTLLMILASAFALTACNSGGPNEEQAKQAIYDFYRTDDPIKEKHLKETLSNQIQLKSCNAVGKEYECLMVNKESKVESKEVFIFNESLSKWQKIKPAPSYKN